MVVLDRLSENRHFTVVVLRHDGDKVLSVLLAWYRSRTADESLRALLPKLGLGDIEVPAGDLADYLSFDVDGASHEWFGFVVPSGQRAFRAAMRDAGLAV